MYHPRIAILSTLLAAAWSLSDAFGLECRLRRPVAVECSADGQWLYTANRDSGSVSVIETATCAVVEEIEVGGELTDLAVLDDRHLLVLDAKRHLLLLLTADDLHWQVAARLAVADYPVQLQVNRAANKCCVTSLWSRTVTMVDLADACREEQPRLGIAKQLQLPFEPREMCFAQDDQRLIVAGAFRNQLAIVDVNDLQLISSKEIPGHNIRGLALDGHGHLLISQQELSPLARSTNDDVHWGNMLSNQLVSLPLDDVLDPLADVRKHRVVTQLGEPGNAAGDPGALIVGPPGSLAIAFSGVNEIALGRFQDDGYDFRRVAVGRRPSALASSPDGRLFVADMFADSITVVDPANARQLQQVKLGPQPELSPAELGEMLFFDGRLSHDGWMSCHSCHTDGHTSDQLNDNLSDGSFDTPKRVLSLLGVEQTGPWAWNGRVESLDQQVSNSIQNTMQGKPPTEEQVVALVAYLKTLESPPPLVEQSPGETDLEILRGREIFQSLNCQSCHVPPSYTSPQAYDVGLSDSAGNTSFNPPSLRGVGRRAALLHDASAASMAELLSNHRHQLVRELSATEFASLLRFLDSI